MDYDLIIIGAGTAGCRCAVTAANNGANTLLVGNEPVGGTCLNTGCIPTKALLHAADVYRTCSTASKFGVRAIAKPSFKKILSKVNEMVSEGRSHVRSSLTHTPNLTFVKGNARFIGSNVIEVNGSHYYGKHIVIATGSSPFIPPVQGLEGLPYLTSDNIWSLKKQPSKLTILGGGYIACEFASFFAAIGTKVTVVELAPNPLMVLDSDVRDVVVDSLKSMGVKFICGVAATRVSYNSGRFVLSLAGSLQSRVFSDALLVACGRRPNTQGLSLEKAGVEVDGRGYVVVNNHLSSSNPSVSAIGDVNGKSLFAHTAKRESWLVLEKVLLNKRVVLDYDKIPWAVFTHPVVAGVGLSEHQLRLSDKKYDVLVASFSRCGKARIIHQTDGFLKVLHHKGKILGAQVVGPQADVIIHEFVALMHFGSKGVDVLHKMVHAHPTLSEVSENLTPRD